MSINFQLALKKNNGNLHVTPKGDFDGSSACELINLLHEQYNGNGCVFIETDDLRDVCPFGCSVFQCRLNQRRVPADRLFFKGKNGLKIAPHGSKVIASQMSRPCDNITGCVKDKGHKNSKN
jgi:hypothetical protein